MFKTRVVLTTATALALLTATPIAASARQADEQPHGVQYQQTKTGLITWVDGRKTVYTDQDFTDSAKHGGGRVLCEWSAPETDHTVAEDVLDRGAGVAFPYFPIKVDLNIWTTTVYKSCAKLPVRKHKPFVVVRQVHDTFQTTDLDDLHCGPKIGLRTVRTFYTALDNHGHSTPANRLFTLKCLPGVPGNTKTKTFAPVRLYGSSRWKNKIGIDTQHANDVPQESHRGTLPWGDNS